MKKKRAQSELITVILLILIGIGAVALVATFVAKTVRSNLTGTDCIQAADQLSIYSDGGYTIFYTAGTNKYINLSIQRGSKDINITGFAVSYGTEFSTNKITVNSPTNTKVRYITPSGAFQDNLVYPQPGERKAYNIDVTGFEAEKVTKISIAPILLGDKECQFSEMQALLQT
jgi:hypothetical protein